MTQPPLAASRRQFADDLRRAGAIRSAAVIAAFASVPRERFLGEPPWMVFTAGGRPAMTSDPRDLYRNVLVALDPARGINNGEPLLWALLFDRLDLAPGQRVVHVGAGTGYYSAILAEMVAPQGWVDALEVDPALAPHAAANLAYLPRVRLVAADGFTWRPERPADAIVVSAGVATLSVAWLDSLAPEGGRLLVPFTTSNQTGAFLLIRRLAGKAGLYSVEHLLRTGIISCTAGRTAQAETRLRAALACSGIDQVRSLHRSPEPPDASCWLAGEGWWLSTAPTEP